jgi:phytoene desaturase
MVSKYFKDPRHRFMFSFHPLFIGGSPFRSPAVYLMIPYLEKAGGVWFAKGGMYSLVEAMLSVFKEIGGQVYTDSEVNEIVVKDARAYGIIANNEYHEADLVVSNAHFAHTHLDLLKAETKKPGADKRIKKKAYSMSSFLLYLGVKKQYPQLKHHTLILSERYKALVKDIFDNKILPDDFSMFLHSPSRTDESMAPKGSESMYVLVPVANLAADINWKESSKPFTDKIINFLQHDFGMEGLKENIEVLETYTPEDFSTQRNNYLGSAWGLEPKLTQSASFRPGNRHGQIDALYTVGASTHPGAGVPGVLLTAEATEKAILKDFN